MKNDTALSPRFDDALAYASELHRSQVRKGTPVPYISHLLIVAGTVLDNGGSEDEAIAALLHDAVEDQGGTAVAAEIRERFGDPVADVVIACSDADTTPKPPWRERKETFIERLQNADASVRRVVAADKLHNAAATLRDYRKLGEALWERFNGGRVGTLWYYRSVTDALRAGGRTPLVDELVQIVTELETAARAVEH